MVQIITDSAADLQPQEYEQLGVTCIPLRVAFGDREYLENAQLDKERFYELLLGSEVFPKTSQASPAVLEEILKMQGYRIIYSVITSDNQGSIEFHKKLGYTFVAEFPGCGHKFGRRLGTIWLEKQVDFVEYPHNFPVPCRDIIESDEKLSDILDKLSIS